MKVKCKYDGQIYEAIRFGNMTPEQKRKATDEQYSWNENDIFIIDDGFEFMWDEEVEVLEED